MALAILLNFFFFKIIRIDPSGLDFFSAALTNAILAFVDGAQGRIDIHELPFKYANKDGVLLSLEDLRVALVGFHIHFGKHVFFQVVKLLHDAFEAAGLNLYLRPYGCLPTGYECGIIEVRTAVASQQRGRTTTIVLSGCRPTGLLSMPEGAQTTAPEALY